MHTHKRTPHGRADITKGRSDVTDSELFEGRGQQDKRILFGIFCRMAWRNLWRNPLRSWLTLSALAGGMIVLIFYAGLMNGMTQHMIAFATEVNTGHLQVHRTAFRHEQDIYATLPWGWLAELESAMPDLSFSPRAYGAGLISSEQASLGVSLLAVVFEKEMSTTRFLRHIRKGVFAVTEKPNAAIVALGGQLARQLKVAVGDEIVLMTQAADGSIGNDIYQVGAIFKPLSPAFDRNGVVMHMEDFQQLMAFEMGFHELVVRTTEPERVAEIADELKKNSHTLGVRMPLDDLGGAPQVRTWQELVPMIREMLDLSVGVMLMVGFVLVGLAALGMVNTTLMAMHERTHELGLLRALGLTSRAVCFLVLLEVFFLSFFASVIGTVLGVVVTHYVGRTGIDFSGALPEGFDWGGMVFEPIMPVVLDVGMILPTVIFMLCLTLVAVILPVRRSLRRSPVEMLS